MAPLSASSLPALPLALLGATSRIASDFILTASVRGASFALFARRPEAVAAFLADHDLPAEWNRGNLDAIETAEPEFGAVLNFVGVGDPAKAKEMGASIFAATRASDEAALGVLDRAPSTPYVFMSSGAVYGTGFDQPADAASPTTIPVNHLGAQDYYSVAKLHAEATHRAYADRTIVDLRIFNYLSRRLDRNARFLITDMVRAIARERVFETTDQPMFRDYLHPEDFCDLLLACITAPAGANRPVDAYSRAPIAKRDLLDLMASDFGLRYRFVEAAQTVNATGAKPHYYSRFRAAADLGYAPRHSSADTIRSEVGALLAATRG